MTLRVCIGLILAAVLVFTAPAHAQTIVHKRVTWDVDALAGHSAGPYTLNFQLIDGAGIGNGNTVISVSNAPFAAFTLTNTLFFESMNAAFTPTAGVPLQFDLAISYSGADSPNPDGFSIAVLDSTLFEIPTLGPADASATIDVTGLGLVTNTYAGDVGRTPNAGGAPIALAAPVITDIGGSPAVPEPSSWGLFLVAACVGLPGMVRRYGGRKRTTCPNPLRSHELEGRGQITGHQKRPGAAVRAAILASFVIAPLLIGQPAAAAPVTPWNVCREFHCYYVVQSFSTYMTLRITNQNFDTGQIQGEFNGIAFTGSMIGSTVAWDLPSLSVSFRGTVSSSNKLSGTLLYVNEHGEWHGFWGPTVEEALYTGPGISVQPNPLIGGQSGVGLVSLTYLPSAPYVAVSLSSTDPAVSIPSSIVIGADGVGWATFAITTIPTDSPLTVTLTATYDDSSGHVVRTVDVVVLPGVRDVTSACQISRGGLRKNLGTGRWSQTVTVKNVSGAPIAGPISLVLDNLSGTATLFNKSGDTVSLAPVGSPYRDSVAASLAPGVTVSYTLEFTNPTNVAIVWTPRILAGSGMR